MSSAAAAAAVLTDRYRDALVLAFDLHREQRRKATEIPYVAHLISVSALALEHGATEDEAIAALLHDAAEDQGGEPTLARIRAQFGDAVADIVAGCSDSMGEPKPPWRERKEHYLAHLAHAGKSIALVSGCDKLHNARAILSDLRRVGAAVWDRFTGGRDGTLWYYASLCDTLASIHSPVAGELRRVVDEMRALA